jgi:thiamine kinase-like enzyme
MSNFCSKIFSGGISNSLIGIYYNENEDDMVLMKVYGRNTDKFIDRKAELRSMELFNKRGCGSKIYAAFKNGIAYAHIPGTVVGQGSDLTIPTKLNYKTILHRGTVSGQVRGKELYQ